MIQKHQDILYTKLIDGCQSGDQVCQKELYDLTVGRLYNVIYRMVVDHHLTEDLLQEAYINIFQKMSQYDSSRGRVYSWMCKICINGCLNHFKKRRPLVDYQERYSDVPDNHFSSLENLEAQYILNFVKKLPEIQRFIFNLHEIEGYKHSEIAKQLGINVNTSRTYLSRAKSKLKNQIVLRQKSSNER